MPIIVNDLLFQKGDLESIYSIVIQGNGRMVPSIECTLGSTCSSKVEAE
jgi:hypothetical protein